MIAQECHRRLNYRAIEHPTRTPIYGMLTGTHMANDDSSKTPNHALSEMKCPVSLEDVDLFGPGAQEHWYEAYEILHAEDPVRKIPGEGFLPGSDAYILTKYEDISRVVKDPERFPTMITKAIEAILPAIERAEAAGEEDALPPTVNAMIVSMATLRPTQELYRAHRQELTDPWVGPGATRHSQMIERTADELIDDWIGRGSVEFVSEFARPLPQRVLASILGFPREDIPQLADWGTIQVMPFVHGKGHRNQLTPEQAAEQAEGLEGFGQYVKDQVAEKRRRPQDDMISFLTDVTYQALGRKLTDTEIIGVVYAMVLGGLETTQYALEEQAQLLCDDPALYADLRSDRSKLRAFTEEGMRVRAPTQGLSTRMTSQDEVFQGVEVPKGSLLHIRFGAGNVDAEEYACPHEIQLDRKRLGGHLTFSQGPRICPGAGISRLEQTIAWDRLLNRIEAMRFAPGNQFRHQPGIMLGTLDLHLEFEAARA
jgi:cytochrome P450